MKNLWVFIFISIFNDVHNFSTTDMPIFCDSCPQLDDAVVPAVYLSIFSAKKFRAMEPHHVIVFSEITVNGSYPASSIPDFIFSVKCDDLEYQSEPLKLKIGTVQNTTIPIRSLPQHVLCSLNFTTTFTPKTGENGPWTPKMTYLQENKVATKILIQTDKPVYKPKDIVRLRVLVLDGKWKVHPPINITVEISDSEKNTIKRWKNVLVTNGLFSNNLTLSEEPNLGDWKLTVISSEKEAMKTIVFKIYKYTPPKFRVHLKHASYITIKDSSITVDIRAFYTYGKGIDGIATISIKEVQKLNNYSQLKNRTRILQYLKDKINKSVEIVDGIGKYTVNVDFNKTLSESELSRTYQNHIQEFVLTAIVTENATKHFYSEEFSIKLYQKNYKFTLLSPTTQKPFMQITVKFKITTQDNIPVYDPRPDAVVITSSPSTFLKYGVTEIKHSVVPENGIVSVDYDLNGNHTDTNYQWITFNAVYEDVIFPITVHFKNSYSKSGIEMNIYPSTNIVSPGQTIGIVICTNSAQQNLKLNYFLKSDMKFLDQGVVTLPNNDSSSSKRFRLQIPEQQLQDNQIQLCIFFFADSSQGKDLIFESTNLLVKQNSTVQSLQLQTSKTTYRPGEEIELHFVTNETSASILAIRAVDESILLLTNSDNDITAATLELGPFRNDKSSVPEDQTFFGHYIYSVSNYISRCDLSFMSYSFDITDESNTKITPSDEPNNCAVCTPSGGSVKKRFVEMFDGKVNNEYLYYDYDAIDESFDGENEDYHLHDGIAKVFDSLDPPQPKIPKVRKHFPETWIWTEVSTTANNSITTIKTILPDTMTTWAITAFSLNSDSGLSVMTFAENITTFQPFFLSLNLPYSVIKEKAFSLQVLVHNYLSKGIIANVSLDNSQNEFQLIGYQQEFESNPRKLLEVPANKVAAITFVIVPKIFGNITLNVNASSDIGSNVSFSDALSQQLLVTPDGVKKTETKNILIDLRSTENTRQEHDIAFSLPTKRVRGADRIKINIVGDVMGISTENLDNLIHLPTGCGEQNMLKFVPDVVILRYLKARGSLTAALENKLLKYLEIGFMQQLKFRHPDGSYSAFGFMGDFGSTWLTAFVIKSFAWAREFINIDDEIFEKGLEFLVSTQNQDTGEFMERGRVFQTAMQGGSGSKGVRITAYVSLALQQVAHLKLKAFNKFNLTSAIENSLNFISRSNDTNDPFSVILSAYALQNANHDSDIFYEAMNKHSTQTPRFMYWEKSDGSTTKDFVSPLSIEMTSYALLTYLSRNQFHTGLPVFKWLISQRNSNGGFKSTQDTVVGLMALAKYAEKLFSPLDNNLTVSIEMDGQRNSFFIDDINQGLQEIILKNVSSAKRCRISAYGNGTAVVQVSSSYYVKGKDYDHSTDGNSISQPPPFIITAKINKLDDEGKSVKLTVSTKATYTTKTSMAVVEVHLPPTYTIYEENLEDVKNTENVMMVEMETGKGKGYAKLIVYYDSLSFESSAFTVILSSFHSMANIRTLSIVAYEYNGDKKAVIFKKLPQKTICDLCIEGNACDIQNCTM